MGITSQGFQNGHDQVADIPDESPMMTLARDRYCTAYAVANNLLKTGNTFMGLSWLLVLASIIVGYVLGTGFDMLGLGVVIGFVFGAGLALGLYALGMLVAASGQILLANLDTAVNTEEIVNRTLKIVQLASIREEAR